MADRLANLNVQQRAAVKAAGHRCLVSCPGSGKTRTIVAKLLEGVDQVRGTPRRIGCITYTNAAVYEIERRLREEGGFDDDRYCIVSTIHSFCLRTLLQPFGQKLDGLKVNRKILPPDSELFREIVEKLMGRHDLHARAKEGFQNIGFNLDGSFLLPGDISASAAADFFALVAAEGYMTFSEILYMAYRVITSEPFIAQALSSRFAWLLVDEFQDTTELQAGILKVIARAGRTWLFVVGDPNQSIYSFAGARPGLMAELAADLHAKTEITLFGNYRSSRRLVEFAELICPATPAMEAVGSNADYPAGPQCYHSSAPFDAIMTHFLPALSAAGIELGKASVLASSWYPLYDAGRLLREAGVPIMGPGARPYKRATAFARFAEEVSIYLARNDPGLASHVQRAFFLMLVELVGRVPSEADGIQGKQVLVELVRELAALKEREALAVRWINSAALLVARVLYKEGVLTEEQADLLIETGDAMVEQIRQNLRQAAQEFSVEEIGLFPRAPECLRLQTIHSAKGQEFDAVAVIDLHEGRIPFHLATTRDELEEERRKLYVACTRARKILMLFTDSSDHRNRPSRFLDDLRHAMSL